MSGKDPLANIWTIWKLAQFGTVCNSFFKQYPDKLPRVIAFPNKSYVRIWRMLEIVMTGCKFLCMLHFVWGIPHHYPTRIVGLVNSPGYFGGAPLTFNGDHGNIPANLDRMVLSIKWPHKCVNEIWRGLGLRSLIMIFITKFLFGAWVYDHKGVVHEIWPQITPFTP